MYGNINKIIIVESLGHDEWHTGKEMYNDVIKPYIDYSNNNVNIQHAYHAPFNADEFENLLIEYERELESNIGVLFHFEIHGHDEKDGLIFANKSFLDWKTILDLLRPINIKLGNKLYLSLAVCFGRYLGFQTIDLKQRSPICAYISTRKPILNSDIIEAFSIFFKRLISTGNIVKAYEELTNINTRLIFKDVKSTIEAVFRSNIEAYIKDPIFREQQRKNSLMALKKHIWSCIKNDVYDV